MERKINIKSLDLILPAYNEELTIKKCIEDFEKLKLFNNIIVIDNNSTDKTKEEIKKTSALYFAEKKQGYGAAIKKGFYESKAEVVVLCEPDLTFNPNDIFKLIEYSNDFNCVFGTRTSKSMIAKGAKMYPYLRYGNILVAKLLGYLFKGPSLTDVGCSFKLFEKKCINEIYDSLKVDGSHFQAELMVRLIKKKYSIVEIPVFYLNRIGYSKITYNFNSSLKVAIKMLIVILSQFFIK